MCRVGLLRRAQREGDVLCVIEGAELMRRMGFYHVVHRGNMEIDGFAVRDSYRDDNTFGVLRHIEAMALCDCVGLCIKVKGEGADRCL